MRLYLDTANVKEIQEAALAGGDICTMPFSVFQQLVKHPLTDLGMKKFLAEWKVQLEKSQSI